MRKNDNHWFYKGNKKDFTDANVTFDLKEITHAINV